VVDVQPPLGQLAVRPHPTFLTDGDLFRALLLLSLVLCGWRLDDPMALPWWCVFLPVWTTTIVNLGYFVPRHVHGKQSPVWPQLVVGCNPWNVKMVCSMIYTVLILAFEILIYVRVDSHPQFPVYSLFLPLWLSAVPLIFLTLICIL
jgi:hypothetical protein